MKKLLVFLCALILVFCVFGSASAAKIPFQVSGGDLTVTWITGGGIWNYTPYAMANPVELGQGEDTAVTFGQIFVPLAIGTGTAEFGVEFTMPTLDEPAGDTATFFVWSIAIISGGDLDFGSPETFNYSYGGAPGGVMELAFNNLNGIQLGSWVNITGTITNEKSPDATIPEPATMILLGSGLLGMFGIRRKFRKS